MKRYIRSAESYKPITKSAFTFKMRTPYGGRLQGYENAFVYDVYYNDHLLCDDAKGFTSKAKASQWLGKFLRAYNTWCKGCHNDGLTEYKQTDPIAWVKYGFSNYK